MNEQLAENPAILEKWLQKRRSRDAKEKDERNMQVEAEEHAPVDLTNETMEEKNEAVEPVVDKEKQARVQSVFSLVRSQIRTQAGLDAQRMCILDVVHQATKELKMSKRVQGEPPPTVEITSSEEAVEQEDQKDQRETVEEGVQETGKGEEVCVALLEEVLLKLESLKKELREELSQFRIETQSYTERAIGGLETRLTNLLRIQAVTCTTPAALLTNHTAESAETKKHRPPSMPYLGASRRQMLNRTMTTITPKTCLTLSLGPRSSSEPRGGWGVKTATSNAVQMLLRRDEMISQPPGTLPPPRPPAQTGKKTVRSRTRISKQKC